MDKPRILLRAENGPILAADETGLVMRLSDRVVADLARRLGTGAPTTGAVVESVAEIVAVPVQDAAILGDIDAWDVTRNGDWLGFTARLPGAEGTRRYLRHVSGPGIAAQTPGPVLGVFSLAGGRRFNAPSLRPDFPFHVLGMIADDAPDETTPLFQNLRHCGQDADLCCAMLHRRHDSFRALPLFATGLNLLAAAPLATADITPLHNQLARFTALARALGKSPRIAAFCIEIGPDNLAPGMDAEGFHRAALALLDGLAAAIAAAGLPPARFLLTLDCGGWWGCLPARARIAAEGICRLALCPGGHDLTVTGSTAPLPQDRLGQPTRAAARIQATLESLAIEAHFARESWIAPVLCLAERDGPRRLRAVFKSEAPLHVDAGDPMRAGSMAGFALYGAGDAAITAIEIAPGDDRSLLLTLSDDLPADGQARLDYAIPTGQAMPDAAGGPPGWAGALRDEWQARAATGDDLFRWALPASQVIR